MFCYLDVTILVLVKFQLFTTDKFLCIPLRSRVLSYKILISNAGAYAATNIYRMLTVTRARNVSHYDTYM